MLQKTRGIVLKVKDYGESHQIVRIFSEQQGKFSIMARGSKKTHSRLGAATEPLTEAEFLFYQGSGLASMSQADVLTSYRQLRSDLLLMTYCAYWLDLIDHNLAENEAHSALYHRLVSLLTCLGQGLEPEILTRIWELNILHVTGYKPIFDRCVRCHGTDLPVYLSANQGGFLCQKCRGHDSYAMPIGDRVAKLLPQLQIIDPQRIGQVHVKLETCQGLEQAIHHLLNHHDVVPRKTWGFFVQIREMEV